MICLSAGGPKLALIPNATPPECRDVQADISKFASLNLSLSMYLVIRPQGH
jgi:hypothetical protein